MYDIFSVVTSVPVIASWIGLAHNQNEMAEKPNQSLPGDMEEVVDCNPIQTEWFRGTLLESKEKYVRLMIVTTIVDLVGWFAWNAYLVHVLKERPLALDTAGGRG